MKRWLGVLLLGWCGLCLIPVWAEKTPGDDIQPDQVNLDNLAQPLVATTTSPASEGEGKPESPIDPRLQEFIAKGRALFADPNLGNGEKSCLSCHSDPVASLGGKIQTYPKYSKVAKTIINQVHQINLCLTKPMKGQALAADDERMTALIAYLVSLGQPE